LEKDGGRTLFKMKNKVSRAAPCVHLELKRLKLEILSDQLLMNVNGNFESIFGGEYGCLKWFLKMI